MLDSVEPGKTLVSVQWANNETGVLQPILELAAAARAAGAVFHTDAVQAVGKVRIDLDETPIDLLSLSGHKLHGPLGVGALVGPAVRQLDPLVFGGAQEKGLRPGTENVPAIVGLGIALECRAARFDAVADATLALRDQFEARLSALGLVAALNGAPSERLPNTSNVRFADVDGEALTIRLDQLGVRCSQSSACTNHKPEPSYVLRAMGLSEAEAYSSVRFGFSELNTFVDVEAAVDAIATVHESLPRFAVA
jgi:cysteine desulfurase